jgi:protein TonB
METIAKYAYEVYKKGSFTKASKNLFISQPSLSAAISKLENDLGFRIFDRSTVPCSLTPQGKIYIESIEEIIEIAENDAEVEESTIEAVDNIEAAVEVKYGNVEVEEEEVEEEEVFMVVEEAPEFPGGTQECMKWLSKNIVYPQISAENGVQGRVTVSFVVNKDGSIVDAAVLRGVDPYLDKEALRVVNKMPKWKPGKQRGKPVRVKFNLPITFRLQ